MISNIINDNDNQPPFKLYSNNLKKYYDDIKSLDDDIQQIYFDFKNSNSINQSQFTNHNNLNYNQHLINNQSLNINKNNINQKNINDKEKKEEKEEKKDKDKINQSINNNQDNKNLKDKEDIKIERNTFYDMNDMRDMNNELEDIIYQNDKYYEDFENYEEDNESDIEEDKIDGGIFQSYDEKNYDKGILRQKDKLIDKEKNIYSYKYIDIKNNKEIKDEKILDRIRKLRIPPKWNYVWISKNPNSEIQVIGHDDRGKKQYLYTTEHKLNANKKKFENLSLLVSLIPKLDKVLEEDEKLGDYDKDKILSTITKIILITGIRAGKEFHVSRNKSYGITSLRKKHIKFIDDKKEVILKFKGKSNINHTHIIKNEFIFNHLKKIFNLKLSNDDDDKLFLYYDKLNKEVKKIDEFDLNNYLHQKIHPDIVIKDLRTYLVNYLLISSLLKNTTLKITKSSNAKLKKFIKKEIENVANYIQHTPSICKNSYIYPPIIDKFLNDPSFFLNKKDSPYNILKLLTS